MTIDPDVGGATYVEGGHSLAILSAGYIGSTIIGGIFVLSGFDTLMAKIVSFVLGLGLVAPLTLVRNKLCVFCLCILVYGRLNSFVRSGCAVERALCNALCDAELIRTILLTIIYEGLLVGFWFIDHAWVFTFY